MALHEALLQAHQAYFTEALDSEHGVDKIYVLPHNQTSAHPCVYLLHASSSLDLLQDQLSRCTGLLLVVPRVPVAFNAALAGVRGDLRVMEFPLDWIPHEPYLYSMDMPRSFKSLMLDGDNSLLYSMARGLVKIQSVTGIIPKVLGKGVYAQQLAALMKKMMANVQTTFPALLPRQANSMGIDSMIILDRNVDLVTPMCTQLTYEGLIDEMMRIQSTFVEVDPSIVGTNPPATGPASVQGSTAPAPVSNRPKKVALNDTDRMYSQLRHLNFAVIGSLLNQAAKRIHEDYEGRHQAKTVSQIKDFIGKLGNLQSEHQSLRLHTHLAELITKRTLDADFNKMLEVQQNFVAGVITQPHIDYIEEMIAKQSTLTSALRLLSIYSICNGGLKAKTMEFFKREIVQTYGYQHMFTLKNLERVHLLQGNGDNWMNYSQVRKSMRLVVDDVNEHTPNDMAYVYSGYAPLSVRMVQAACFKSVQSSNATVSGPVTWKGWEDALRGSPGPLFEETLEADSLRILNKSKDRAKTTIVVFVGGCTYTEIAALRFLSEQHGREFLVFTSDIITGNSVVESLAFTPPKAPTASATL